MTQGQSSESSGGASTQTGVTTTGTTPTISTTTTPTNVQPERATSTHPNTSRYTRLSTRNNFNNLSRIETGDSNTKGENELFGYVIGTRNEKLTNGRVYDEFKDLLVTLLGLISNIEMIF